MRRSLRAGAVRTTTRLWMKSIFHQTSRGHRPVKSLILESGMPMVIIHGTSPFVLLWCVSECAFSGRPCTETAVFPSRCVRVFGTGRCNLRAASGGCRKLGPDKGRAAVARWKRWRRRRYSFHYPPLFLMIEDWPHAPHLKAFWSPEPVTSPCCCFRLAFFGWAVLSCIWIRWVREETALRIAAKVDVDPQAREWKPRFGSGGKVFAGASRLYPSEKTTYCGYRG